MLLVFEYKVIIYVALHINLVCGFYILYRRQTLKIKAMGAFAPMTVLMTYKMNCSNFIALKSY